MDSTTYDYLKPTEKQMELMALMREASKVYGKALEDILPDGSPRI
jgi:hypothetical protein